MDKNNAESWEPRTQPTGGNTTATHFFLHLFASATFDKAFTKICQMKPTQNVQVLFF